MYWVLDEQLAALGGLPDLLASCLGQHQLQPLNFGRRTVTSLFANVGCSHITGILRAHQQARRKRFGTRRHEDDSIISAAKNASATDFHVPKMLKDGKLNEVMLLSIAIVAPWQRFSQQSYIVDNRVAPRFAALSRTLERDRAAPLKPSGTRPARKVLQIDLPPLKWSSLKYDFRRRVQLIAATHSANFSAGV